MQTVIVASHEEDAHCQRVLRRAEEKGVHAIQWDVSEYPQNALISLDPSGGPPTLSIKGSHVRNLSGIYWRRPTGKYRPTASTSKLQAYMEKEGRVVSNALCHFYPDINWISIPGQEQISGNKPLQLKTACDLGMQIPRTCITNSPEELTAFLTSLGDTPVTMKPVGSAFIDLDESGDLSSPKNMVVFTKVVDHQTLLENANMVRNCPTIFQEAIEKVFDLRITVVDNRVFAARIDSYGCSDEKNLDWRNYEGTRVYSAVTLPPHIERQCIEIISALNLRFGCIDMGVTEEGDFFFFEVNPQGQWLPSEMKLEYDISGAVVDGLTQSAHSAPSIQTTFDEPVQRR